MSPSPRRTSGHEQTRSDETHPATPPDTADTLEASVRVLHVDDDADLAEMTATFLERASEEITVVTETSPLDGLERLDNERIDCIVSDYQMPRMNGLEFLEQVREEDGEIPFILFTGRGSEAIAGEAITAGVTDYLQKETGMDQYAVLANRIRNVAEQYRAEQKLDVLRSRYELVASASSDAVLDWDLETDDLWWSEGLQRTFGYSAEAIEDDLTWLEDRIHPDDRQRVLETIQETFENGEELLEATHRFRRADGTYAHIITRGHVVYEADEPIRMACTLIDVTEHKEREETVRASERRFRALTESVTDAVITIDTDSTITYANAATEQLFGYSDEELRGASLTMLMPDRLGDRHQDGIDQYLRTGDRTFDWTGVELPGEHKDGTEIPLTISFGEFEHDGQQFFTGVVRDVTERTERERELQRQNDRLDEFASVISHDLRNPLNVAVGRLELAREERDSEHLDTVAQSLDRMDTLIGELLTLTHQGQAIDEVEPVALAEVVETAKLAVDSDACTVAVESELGTVTGQRSRISVLVENLFRNAVRHGGPDVTIRVGTLDGVSAGSAERSRGNSGMSRPSGDDVSRDSADHSSGQSPREDSASGDSTDSSVDGFYVEDDGPGIPEGEREDVFEAGYTTKTGGTGLGLHIVETIVEAHGWDITVTDSTEGGARIEIVSSPENAL